MDWWRCCETEEIGNGDSNKKTAQHSFHSAEICCFICHQKHWYLHLTASYLVTPRPFIYIQLRKNKKKLLFMLPLFMGWSKTLLLCSPSVSTHLFNLWQWALPFAKIIPPPDRCVISRCWLKSVFIAQVCHGLDTKSLYGTHGSVQLTSWPQECRQALLTMNWMFVSLP